MENTTMNTLISPSILSADFADIANVCKQLQSAKADWVNSSFLVYNF